MFGEVHQRFDPEAERRRHQREVDEGRALLERREASARSAQFAQNVWSARRAELRADVVRCQGELSGAEARMHSSDIDEAVRAAAEANVFRMRLAEAELAYARHAQRSPL